MKNILVNIAGRILGPYTTKEVIKNLLEKRFLPMHEILWPGGRWSCINTHPAFVEICSKIADLNIDNENIEELTHSLTASFVTSTYANEGSHKNTALSFGDNTQAVLNTIMDKTQKVNIQGKEEEGTCVFFPTEVEAGVITNASLTSQSLKNKTDFSSSDKSSTNIDEGSTYISPTDKKEKLAIWKLNKIWWISLCIFSFIILGFLWQKEYFQIRNNQRLNLVLAEQLLNKNQFQESLKVYKQVITLSEVNKLNLSLNVYENYALLLLLVDQDSFEVKELVSTSLKSSANKERFLILSYLSSGDIKEALSILNTMSNKTMQDWLNIASAYYLQGLYLKALKMLNQLSAKEARILSVLVYIKLYQKTLDQNWLVKANNLLGILKNSFYYRQKLSLIRVYIQSLLGKLPQKKDIVSILDQDPYLEKDMKVNLFIYSSLWSWGNLNSYCEGLVSSAPGKLIFKALKVFCLSKGKKKKKDWRLLLESLDRSKDILVGSVLAYVYRQEKLMDKYVVKLAHLTESLHARSSLLLLNLELRYCIERQNKKCIKSRVRDLLNINSVALFALFHRMKLYQSQGLKKEAKKIHIFFKNRASDYILF